MSRLEDLRPNAAVRGILPESLVTVVTVQWFGSEALELTYKNPAGRVANELLYRHDEARLDVLEQGRPWSFDGDRFEGRFRDGVHQVEVSDLMRRMVKENLRKFDGTPLFPERIARTVPYRLSNAEAQLYKAVTDYVRERASTCNAPI
jgi:hypothetical protein